VPDKEATGKTNEERERELLRRIAEADAEEEKNAKLFDPADLLKSVKAIRQKKIPGVGLVNYGVLSFDELLTIGKTEDKNEQAKITLFMMLSKAYPEIKKEDIGKYPGTKVIRLLELLKGSDDNFLLAQKTSPSGSKQTLKRK